MTIEMKNEKWNEIIIINKNRKMIKKKSLKRKTTFRYHVKHKVTNRK